MASISTTADLPQREFRNTSQRTASSPSTSVISSYPSFCLNCFDWVSSFIAWPSVQSNSMASTSTPDLIRSNEVMGDFEGIPPASASTTDRIPENDVMGAFERILPSASTSSSDLIPENKVTGAFHGPAPSGSSSSTLIEKPCYDVLISHHGPKVKYTLDSELYRILSGMRLSVFWDSQESQLGDLSPRTIEAAMTSAWFHIAIFSESYAESPRCLTELLLMLKSGTPIFPVFYHVDPSDLRCVSQGKGIYVDAFKKHEQKGRYTLEQLNEWKEALYKVSFCEGQVIENNEDEMRLLKNIVTFVSKHPVGLKEIVEDFEKNTLQTAEGNKGVQIVGIWGMSGSGKTTLAKELYKKISPSMEWSSFVVDVRNAAIKSLLHEKQKKILEDLGIQGVEFDNIEKGMRILSRHLGFVKVLIVLDDVDNVEQLNALLPTITWLERGSLIIVTTRVHDVLKAWNVSSIYKMKPLDLVQAEQLFCRHAFLKSCPPDGFEELVQKFLRKCNGLPLFLEIFGAELYGEFDKKQWESKLNEISSTLSHRFKISFEISYDTLDDEEKEIFLDTACFFIGEESSLAIEVWNGLGWSGPSSWEKLLHSCLVEHDNDNRIRMHDHIRDIAREIANKQSPYRLRSPEQIINIQKQTEKIISIRGIMATSTQKQWINNLKGEGKPLTRSSGEVDELTISCSHGELVDNTNVGIWPLAPSLVGLKIFVLRGDYFNEVMGEVSRTLVWLRWFDIGQKNFPSLLSLKRLRVLELHEGETEEHHLETLWSGTDSEVPVQIRELAVCQCYKFQGVPNSIGLLIHLKKIVIVKAYEVASLPEEFCLLQSLEHLVLYDCPMLSSLPSKFGNLKKLRHLCLSGCSELRMLPVSFKNLMLLKYLDLRHCYELTFTSEDLESMAKLEMLNLVGCEKLEELPRHISNQACLKELYLRGTSLRELPGNIGRLSGLKEMSIGGVLLTSLPESLGGLSLLTNLSIHGCSQLKNLPESLGDLSLLKELEIHNSGVKSLPKSVRQLNSLQRLILSGCPISELDFGAASLPSGLVKLKNIDLRRTELSRISIFKNCCPSLETLTVENNRYLKEIETLPTTLKTLRLRECKMLKNIPSFVRTTSLREFEVRGCHQIEKIEGLEYCMRLESLRVDTCWEVSGIESLEHMKKLRKLQLRANKGTAIQPCIQRIKKWPDGIEICFRADSDASSRVDSLLSTNFVVVDSISNQRIRSKSKLVHKRSSDGDAIMLCLVLNCVSSQMILNLDGRDMRGEFPSVLTKVERGRWAWVGVFTQRYEGSFFTSQELSITGYGGNREAEDEVEKGLVVRGEEQKLMEAVCRLLSLL